ncbi:hypothetical protein ElyMa_002064300 [Elysia marginata]|uniref:Uncharacterized protein n=1 Tax=Elysia marginata TaxID=1093978 RepID=A0AAV4F9Q4_9GAST|nr:hypothetical protein ElyMa_002064300 [Elysia marginata]
MTSSRIELTASRCQVRRVNYSVTLPPSVRLSSMGLGYPGFKPRLDKSAFGALERLITHTITLLFQIALQPTTTGAAALIRKYLSNTNNHDGVLDRNVTSK